jgi:hypothetical protein
VRNRLILAALFAVLVTGCSSSTPTGQTGKEAEARQEAEQRKADDEEKQELKNRKTRPNPKQ